MKEVTIIWNGPYNLENINRHDITNANGIYAIYRVFGGNETLLYLGMTERGFGVRINEHCEDWLHGVRGQIKLRFGVPQLEGTTSSRKMLQDIEALLIGYHKPKENTMSVNYYYGQEKLTVINKGRRGHLVERLNTEEHFVWYK